MVTLKDYLEKKQKMKEELKKQQIKSESIKQTAKARPKKQINYSISNDWLTVDKPDFTGTCFQSPSGKYILGINYGHLNYGKFEKGHYILIKNHELLLHGTIFNPYTSVIADNGNFVIEDNLYHMNSKFKSRLHFFSEKGKLSSKSLYSNIESIKISSDGKYCTIRTLHCNYYPQDCKIITYDIENNRIYSKHD